MTFKNAFLLILAISFPTVGSSQEQSSNILEKLFPTSTTGEIINHKYYSLSYSIPHRQAEWVMYELTCDQTKSETNRSNNFRPDPLVVEGSAQLIDYKGSGFDRGHLAPAGDMKISYEAMSETFYLSNISPQHPSLNRGIWLGLENQVRLWACEDSILFVTAGPIFTKSDSTIGPDQVTVPSFFYKIVFYNKLNDYEIIGFIFPNSPCSMPLKEYVYKVDEIENLTGIDFFPSLPDSIENRIESSKNLKFWHLDN